MKNDTETFSGVLCAETVDKCSQLTRDFAMELKLPNRDVLRYAMTVEEILLKMSDGGNDGAEVRLSMGKKYLSWFVSLEIDGEALNVFAETENEQGALSSGILKNLGLSPDYSYSGKANRYTFRIRRKRKNPFVTLAIAVAAAFIIGALGYFIPEATRSACTELILIPLNDTFLNLLGCIAGPMIFLAVAWGIYGIGDAATLKRIGKSLCFSYIGVAALFTALICLLAFPAFRLSFSSASDASSSLSALLTMLLAIVPTDIFSPFTNGNTLQIIFLAVIFGIAMLFLGRKTDFVAHVVEQVNYIIMFLIEAISSLVPYFIFIVLLKMIWGGMTDILTGIDKLFILLVASVLLSTAVIVFYTSAKSRVSPLLLVKKNLPTLITAFTTASSAAAFGTNMKTAHHSFGINEKLCSFGIPLGVVAYKLNTALNYLLQSLFFAEIYNVSISASWIVIMIISCVILAVATPPIPGGSMATYAVLFAQLGIPVEALGIALACDTVFDFIVTGFDQFSISFVLLNQARKLGLVDRDILMKE